MAATLRRYWFIRSLIVVASLLILAGLWFLFTSTVRASIGCSVEATFVSMPENDSALEGWLTRQPGIVPNALFERLDGKVLRIHYIMLRNLRGEPAFPDLDAACRELGYVAKDKFYEWHPDQ